MDLAFETCGNATLIVYDRGVPVLVTDPWLKGAQYFGSWALTYRFRPEQLQAFENARYVWLSHGHPDHLNLDSLEAFRDRVLLVPRHAGGRISADLKAAGYKVRDLDNGCWVQLSPRIRILSCADWNQDTAALIALGDECAILNLNDGSACGTQRTLRRALKSFRRRFVLGLISYGDADMINYFTESGDRIVPPSLTRKRPLGFDYANLLRLWDASYTAPFSCHHEYARTDSRWAIDYETPLDAHGRGFPATCGQFIPGFFRYDVTADRIEEIALESAPRVFRDPTEFGDDWSEPLDPEDLRALQKYFRMFEHVRRQFGFLNFRVGGRDNFVDLEGPKRRGITFEAPRHSLMTSVRCEIFDDLLIANFARTTLHGDVQSLYPDFTPYVAKYGDNGRAFSVRELREYFRAYRREYGALACLDTMRVNSTQVVRQKITSGIAINPALFNAARRIYRRAKYGG
jgi:hypothetical protein